MYTLIETAKLNDVDPQAWLADMLARIAEHPVQRLDELMPWNWKPATHSPRESPRAETAEPAAIIGRLLIRHPLASDNVVSALPFFREIGWESLAVQSAAGGARDNMHYHMASSRRMKSSRVESGGPVRELG